MARFPGAIWRPITASKGRKALTIHNRVNLHVAVSEAASQHDYFNVSGRADSHFYVRRDGTVEQYVDTSMRAFADLDGNDATISVETQGGVRDPQGEPWTDEQVEALAHLYAWAVRTHDIQVRIATSSKTGAESKGLSWHRLGIDGNFPALPDQRAGRTQRGGGMHYSTSRGKVCPGDTKIGQVPEIFARALALLDPAPTTPTTPAQPVPVVPEPDTTLEDLMGYPFIIRATDDDGWTLVLSPTQQVGVPKLDSAERADLVALAGQPRTVGADLAQRIRATAK